jgi:hypothetical protein
VTAWLALEGYAPCADRATGGNLEGSCLQLLRRVVVEGWLSVLSACRPKALQATPQTMREGQNDAAVPRLGRNLAQPRLA